MIETPAIVQLEAVPAAVIRVVTPRDRIQQVMGQAIGAVIAAAQAQGIGPVGYVFAHHLRMEPGTFDLEVGVPVRGPVTPVDGVQAGEVPAMRAARAVYHGPYEGLHAAWGEFDAWVRAAGHTPATHLVERYVSGPESSANPADWRTELLRPLV